MIARRGCLLFAAAVAFAFDDPTADARGGAVAAPALIVLVLAAQWLPARFALFAWDPGVLRGAPVSWPWITILAVAGVALGFSLRDPLAQRSRQRPC